MLQDWVRGYYERTDDLSHTAHLALYEAFEGEEERREHKSSVRRPESLS